MSLSSTKFSVLMAVYLKDDPLLLSKALLSIINQSIKPSELVLVEDGPLSKELNDVINIYRSKLNIVSVVIKKNQGLATALNHGLKAVSYNYIMRADSDDINLPNRFKIQLKYLNNGYDLVGGNIREIAYDGSYLRKRIVPRSRANILKFAKFRSPFNHMTVAFKKNLINEVGGYPNIKFKEDYALWSKILLTNARIINIPNILVNATAGLNMLKRRSGFKYASSEIALQRHLISFGIVTLLEAFLFGGCRFIFFITPSFFKSFFYVIFLRK